MAVTCLALGALGQAYGGGLTLPPKAAEAVKAAFPKARITGIGRERENGVMYYEVNLRENGKRFEVEVTPDGVIGEIEGTLGLKDLPRHVQGIVAKATKGARKVRIEIHERRARARSGRFVPLEKPTVAYEVKYYSGNRRRRLWLDAREVAELPAKARSALGKAFHGATIGDAELEYEGGVKLYEVELTAKGSSMEVKVSPGGAIVEVATRVAMSDLPGPAAATIKKLAKGGSIKEIDKVQVRAVVKSRRLVRLREPKSHFEAEVAKGGKEAEIRVSAAGRLLESLKWEDDDDDDDDDNDDD